MNNFSSSTIFKKIFRRFLTFIEALKITKKTGIAILIIGLSLLSYLSSISSIAYRPAAKLDLNQTYLRESKLYLNETFGPRLEDSCRRWGVVATTNNPTDAILRVIGIPSWCLVIVPDLNTPVDFMEQLEDLLQRNYSNFKRDENRITLTHNNNTIVYLSVDKQKEFERVEGAVGDFVKATQWNHFSRKNIGYLFAIFNGAQFIFDFTDDVFIKLDDKTGKPMDILPEGNELNEMILKNVKVVIQGATAFNHHPMMDASLENSWARGFPMELIQNKSTQGVTEYRIDYPLSGTLGTQREIGVLQYFIDENPDIDAQLRSKKSLPTLTESSPVLVPSHSYSPYNAKASIHSRDAMFAILMPSTMSVCISDIWRGYFAQCLFADAGLSLVFNPPKTARKHNESANHCDSQEEALLYCKCMCCVLTSASIHNLHSRTNASMPFLLFIICIYTDQMLHSYYIAVYHNYSVKSGELIEFLTNWDSDFDTVPQRMEQLWLDLNKNGYIEYEDVQKMQMWLKALYQLGYEFPPLKNRRFHNVAVMGQFNYVPDSGSSLDNVIFWYQKTSERFRNVIVAGPYSNDQVIELKKHSIEAIQGRDDAGYVSPYLNQMNALLRFKDDDKVNGVLYVHDDGILNMTEIVKGKVS